MVLKLSLIAAVCENMGIGRNNNLPWQLKSEMAYFSKMTTMTNDPKKKNIVVMGRRTWDSIPQKYKPLPGRINVVLSRSPLDLSNYENCHSFLNFDELIDKLNEDEFKATFENVWVIGGSHIYKECMQSKYFYRLYLTKIHKHFECDTFFPNFKESDLKEISDPSIPVDIQIENDIEFEYKVYENPTFVSKS